MFTQPCLLLPCTLIHQKNLFACCALYSLNRVSLPYMHSITPKTSRLGNCQGNCLFRFIFTQPCLFCLYTFSHTINLHVCSALCSHNSPNHASSLYVHSMINVHSTMSLLFICTQSQHKPPCLLRFMSTQLCLFALYSLNHTRNLLNYSALCSLNRASYL